MARRKPPPSAAGAGLRAAVVAELAQHRDWPVATDPPSGQRANPWRSLIAALEAGEPVEFPAHLLPDHLDRPPTDRVRLEGDRLIPIPNNKGAQHG